MKGADLSRSGTWVCSFLLNTSVNWPLDSSAFSRSDWATPYQMNLRYMMFCRTISSVWKLPVVKVKHCGLVPLTQSEAGACDQENFVENWIGHDRSNCNILKSKDADLSNLWYSISHWMLWNFGHCCEWGLFCIVFYGSPWHRNDTFPVLVNLTFWRVMGHHSEAKENTKIFRIIYNNWKQGNIVGTFVINGIIWRFALVSFNASWTLDNLVYLSAKVLRLSHLLVK